MQDASSCTAKCRPPSPQSNRFYPLGPSKTRIKTGHSTAIRILHRAGSALGLAISHLIQLNNPERVVIASLDDGMGSLFRTVTKQVIDAHVLPELGSMTNIRFDDVSEDFWARGAAAIAAHRYLVGAAWARAAG